MEFYVYEPFDQTKSDPGERWGKQRYVVYVLSRSAEPRWVDLGDASTIDIVANRFRVSLAERRSDVLERSRELDALITAKLRPLLGKDVRALVLSPDGGLNLIPFAALVDDEGRYLIERYRLSYVTSGRDLLRLAKVTTSKEQSLLLGDAAFGGDFGPFDTVRGATRAGDMDALRFSRLKGTAKEVKAIGRLFGLSQSRVLTREAATEASVKAVKGPRVLHLATHGFFLSDLPDEQLPGEFQPVPQTVAQRLKDPLLRSGLALSGFIRRDKAESSNDGVLTALEVSGLDLWGTEIVTLSACETGVGDVRTGEGVFGLRRALVLAGARTQVMTLWQVADEPTKDLMVSWYQQLNRGVGRSEATHRVQLAALQGKALPTTKVMLQQRGVKRVKQPAEPVDPRAAGTRHPYYWASFIVSGATGPLVLSRTAKDR